MYLLGMKLKYGLEVFMPKRKWILLDKYFENLEIRPAEDHICNFEEDYNTFW